MSNIFCVQPKSEYQIKQKMHLAHTILTNTEFENNRNEINNNLPPDSGSLRVSQDLQQTMFSEHTIPQDSMERMFSEYFPSFNNDYIGNNRYIVEFFDRLQIYNIQDLTDSIFSVSQVLLRYAKAHVSLDISDSIIDMIWDCIELQNNLMRKIHYKTGWNVVNELISDFDCFIDRSYNTFLLLELDLEIPLDLSLFGQGTLAATQN